MRLVLSYYQQLLNVVLGWADVPLANLIALLNSLTVLALELDPNWKHVFVLMWLYFSSGAKTNWKMRKSFAAFSVVLGGVIAFLTVVIMGIGGADGLLRAAVPMLGVFLWAAIRNLWSALFHISTRSLDAENKSWREIFAFRFLNYALPVLVIAVALLSATLLAVQSGKLHFVSDVGSFALTGFVITMALYWIIRGLYLASFNRRSGESWKARFEGSGMAQLGSLMLSTIGATGIFLVLNAGLQLLGL